MQLIGKSPAIEALRSTIRRVANTDLAILILGENGTGKEVVSQSIHYLSPRRDQPFIAVNCAAITETLLESELFGHEKGAFTDAHEARPGKFELASGGTLFLDEIGDLSLSGQAKLLRVLEEKVVVRVGGSKPIHTDARVIAATNQNLAEMVRQKRFRQDLYFRLNVVTLELPPLRERGDDVLLLAEHFLADFCRQARRKLLDAVGRPRKRLAGAALWPGNVRELRNLMERLAYLAARRPDRGRGPGVHPFAGRPRRRPLVAADLPLSEATEQFQIDYIKQAIERAKRQHEPGRRAAGPAPLESLPQDAPVGHERQRRRSINASRSAPVVPGRGKRHSGAASGRNSPNVRDVMPLADVRQAAASSPIAAMPANTMLLGSGVGISWPRISPLG